MLYRDLSDHDQHVEVSLSGGRAAVAVLAGVLKLAVLVLLHRCERTPGWDLHGNSPSYRRRARSYLHDNCCHLPRLQSLTGRARETLRALQWEPFTCAGLVKRPHSCVMSHLTMTKSDGNTEKINSCFKTHTRKETEGADMSQTCATK